MFKTIAWIMDILRVDRLSNSIVVAFADGTTVLYSAELLHSISAQGETVTELDVQPEPDWGWPFADPFMLAFTRFQAGLLVRGPYGVEAFKADRVLDIVEHAATEALPTARV